MPGIVESSDGGGAAEFCKSLCLSRLIFADGPRCRDVVSGIRSGTHKSGKRREGDEKKLILVYRNQALR